jgi:hypothetical protein
MARYFKIVEIDSDTFINATGEDLDCCQLTVPATDAVYVAVDDEEYEISVSMDTFDDLN